MFQVIVEPFELGMLYVNLLLNNIYCFKKNENETLLSTKSFQKCPSGFRNGSKNELIKNEKWFIQLLTMCMQ